MFNLHPQLAADTLLVGDLALSRVLLMNDKNYPWVILVPRVNDVEEIFQLSAEQQSLLLKESTSLSELMHSYFKADKMNVAALGNVVSQLHLHHIARFKTDISWPRPVWGAEKQVFYSEAESGNQLENLRQLLLPAGLAL